MSAFDPVDCVSDELAKFSALLVGNRGAQVLNFNQPLASILDTMNQSRSLLGRSTRSLCYQQLLSPLASRVLTPRSVTFRRGDKTPWNY